MQEEGEGREGFEEGLIASYYVRRLCSIVEEGKGRGLLLCTYNSVQYCGGGEGEGTTTMYIQQCAVLWRRGRGGDYYYVHTTVCSIVEEGKGRGLLLCTYNSVQYCGGGEGEGTTTMYIQQCAVLWRRGRGGDYYYVHTTVCSIVEEGKGRGLLLCTYNSVQYCGGGEGEGTTTMYIQQCAVLWRRGRGGDYYYVHTTVCSIVEESLIDKVYTSRECSWC